MSGKMGKKCEDCRWLLVGEAAEVPGRVMTKSETESETPRATPILSERRCVYPPILSTFPNGRDAEEARSPGRYCSPTGACFQTKRAS